MPTSKLIRWGGLAALVAAALFIIADFVTFFFAIGQASDAGLLFFRSTAALAAGVLLLLGLVGLYAHQSEATGTFGLGAFLAAFIGLALAPLVPV